MSTLELALQSIVSNELGAIDARYEATDRQGSTVDVRAVEALLEVTDLERELKELQNQVSGVKHKINSELVEQFALLGVQSMNVSGVTVYKHTEQYANAKSDYRTQLVAWAREAGLDDMIVLQPQRFKSWCREQFEDENTRGLPAEIQPMVEIFEKATLRVRRN